MRRWTGFVGGNYGAFLAPLHESLIAKRGQRQASLMVKRREIIGSPVAMWTMREMLWRSAKCRHRVGEVAGVVRYRME